VSPADIEVVQGDTALCPYGTGNLSSRDWWSEVVRSHSRPTTSVRNCGHRRGDAPGGPRRDRTARRLRHLIGRSEQGVASHRRRNAAYTLGYVFAPDIEPTLESTRTFKMPNVRQIPDDKGRYSMYTTFSNGVYISVIELCTETGVVEILDHVIVHDCGTQVNPLFVEGQVAAAS